MCIPALPLAASSGYLFGLIPGFLTVLVSATLAACVSFVIGRTLLRGWAQKIANGIKLILRGIRTFIICAAFPNQLLILSHRKR